MKISVIVPCYNAEKWIEECVASVANQKYDNFELIVVDNESTDNTVEVLKNLQASGLEFTLSSAPNIYPHCWDSN
jgi:alpha-1,6-rhamnosyltransferase